jgi:hypothetical protein
MGLWPIRGDEAGLRSRNHLQRKVSLSFVIPRVCDFFGFFTFLTQLSLLFSASLFM